MVEKLNSIQLGEWIVDLSSGVCSRAQATEQPKESTRLEPKACSMLAVLAENAGQVVTKEELIDKVWPGSYASDDTISRTVSRLRAALRDQAKSPRYIETVPKRGYRLIAPVERISGKEVQDPVRSEALAKDKKFQRITTVALCLIILLLLLFWLIPTNKKEVGAQRLQQADDFYHQMRLADNEMAITLYEQHLGVQPDSAHAYAGLANALVQRTLRWFDDNHVFTSLTQSLSEGALSSPEAQSALDRAMRYAEKAVELEPDSSVALKAKGFVLSAQGKFDEAITFYERALEQSPNTWPVLINLGELAGAQNDKTKAIDYFERAFVAMQQTYPQNEVQIRPWISDVAELIGNQYRQNNANGQAEYWYRQALFYTPLHESSTLALARVLADSGEHGKAVELCRNLNQKLKAEHDCRAFVRVLSD
ncbi:hypothetical protein CEW91_05265 [Idiomarina piscisalsi]|uniref:OmpR/PhoB-type domain-containing protein n=1 Tax=Idiomarina piscisalsi TaxID=1096243 RepID=A0ABN5API6_9GAMM|nr:winged helix-turn-helix domain-containing protein [Idiomarina piscisalsi]ASG65579.1 hypothetical protein CEW91_05265 [Idiomarina piscisalsi]